MSTYREIFEAITHDPRYQQNLDWGKPRRGHPEGTIQAHIAELEGNLEALKPKLSEEEYGKLKVLVHTHDSLKPGAERGVPIAHPASHASLACKFLSEFCEDADLLAIVQHHGVPYALWRQFKGRGELNQERFAALLQKIRDWDLFLAFLIIDGCTKGKNRAPLYWFFEQVAGKVNSRITKEDIL